MARWMQSRMAAERVRLPQRVWSSIQVACCGVSRTGTGCMRFSVPEHCRQVVYGSATVRGSSPPSAAPASQPAAVAPWSPLMPDETKTLDRFAKLLALTSSNHQEEARTAAHMACQLIKNHGLHVSLHPLPPGFSNDAQPKQKQQNEQYKEKRQQEEYREIFVKYSSFCRACRSKIEIGADAWWRPKSGMFCTSCGPPSPDP